MTVVDIDHALTDPQLARCRARRCSAVVDVARGAEGCVRARRSTRRSASTFASIAGDRTPPTKRVRELWAVVGRRGGKSRMAAALAVYSACFAEHHLARGEVGYVLVLAAQPRSGTRRVRLRPWLPRSQSRAASRRSTSSRRARSGSRAASSSPSTPTVSAPFAAARCWPCIFDEVSMWRDESSATPDLEVYRAVLPALMTTGGMLIGISHAVSQGRSAASEAPRPLRRRQRRRAGGSRSRRTAFNPTLTQSAIDAAVADDPEGGRRSGKRHSAATSPLSSTTPLSRPPSTAIVRWSCRRVPTIAISRSCDPSGGRHDAFTTRVSRTAKAS